jgi:hypothetical protein
MQPMFGQRRKSTTYHSSRSRALGQPGVLLRLLWGLDRLEKVFSRPRIMLSWLSSVLLAHHGWMYPTQPRVDLFRSLTTASVKEDR